MRLSALAWGFFLCRRDFSYSLSSQKQPWPTVETALPRTGGFQGCCVVSPQLPVLLSCRQSPARSSTAWTVRDNQSQTSPCGFVPIKLLDKPHFPRDSGMSLALPGTGTPMGVLFPHNYRSTFGFQRRSVSKSRQWPGAEGFGPASGRPERHLQKHQGTGPAGHSTQGCSRPEAKRPSSKAVGEANLLHFRHLTEMIPPGASSLWPGLEIKSLILTSPGAESKRGGFPLYQDKMRRVWLEPPLRPAPGPEPRLPPSCAGEGSPAQPRRKSPSLFQHHNLPQGHTHRSRSREEQGGRVFSPFPVRKHHFL